MKKEEISELVNARAIEEARANWYDNGVHFSVGVCGCEIEVSAPMDCSQPAEVYVVHGEFYHQSPMLEQYIADNLPDLYMYASEAREEDYLDAEDEHMLHRSLERQFIPW